MKYLILAVTVLSLNSCNTLIGGWRDTKVAYRWTKGKIQGANDGGGGGGGNSYGAPVY
jgi:predicted small secreted protein